MTILRTIKNTKKARAALIYKELTDKGATRQQILDRLMIKLGMTLSCASTYNQNFRSGFWNVNSELTTRSAVVEPVVLKSVDLTSTSLYDLQQHWNTNSRFVIPTFRTHAEAVETITRYCPIN